jgi:hypothetical protein
MDKLKASPANLVILIAGVVMLIASFLDFNKYSSSSTTVTIGGQTIHVGGVGSVSYSAWSSHYFLIATIPVLLGVLMAAHVALDTFAPTVKLPERPLGFTWTQIHLVFGAQVTLMMLAFLIRDTGPLDKGIGLFLMLLAAIALLVGAILRTREAPNPATPPPPAY